MKESREKGGAVPVQQQSLRRQSLAPARRALGIYTQEEKDEQWTRAASAKIAELDRDHDGTISNDEMVTLIDKFIETETKKKLLRKQLILVSLAVFALIAVVVGLGAAVVVGAKDTTTTDVNYDASFNGTFLTSYSFGHTTDIVSTGTAEDIFEVVASATSFAELQEAGIFDKELKTVIVTFEGAKVIAFPVETVQADRTGATIHNKDFGVSLHFSSGMRPTFEFVGGADGLSLAPGGVANGPTALAKAKAESSPAVKKIQIIRVESSVLTKLSPSPDAAAESSDSPTTPTTVADRKQSERAELRHAIKALIPLKNQDPKTRAGPFGRITRGDPNTWWLIGCTNVEYAYTLCARFDAGTDFSGECGIFKDPGCHGDPSQNLTARFAAISEDIVSPGILPVTITLEEVNKFREAMRDEGNPCNFTAVQKEFSLLSEGTGGEVKGSSSEAYLALADDVQQDPVHEELQHAVRRLVAATPEGRILGRRMAQKLFKQQVERLGEEEHRRQLNVQNRIFKRTVGRIEEDVTCYRSDKAGFFYGTEQEETCNKNLYGVSDPYQISKDCRGPNDQCVPWATVIEESPRCQNAGVTLDSPFWEQLGCMCKMVKGKARHWQERSSKALLDGAAPRSLCTGMQERFAPFIDKPFCFVRRGAWLVASMGRVEPCFAAYYEAAKNSYSCENCNQVVPYDERFAWQLWRVAINQPQYTDTDYERAFNRITYDGAGVHVFVIDSGINFQHEDLRSAIWDGVDARFPSRLLEVNKGSPFWKWKRINDSDGHGTHVAGIIAGRRLGVAKGVKIHPVRIGTGKQGTMSARAVKWIIRRTWSLRQRAGGFCKVFPMVLFSQGTPAGTYSDALEAMIRDLLNANIAVVASAGNDEQDSCLASPNRLERATALVTVGATNIDDSVAYYSNFGSCVTIYAPGTNIISTREGGQKAGYKTSRGTSQAAPTVAGIMAVGASARLAAGQCPTARSMKNWVKRVARKGRVTERSLRTSMPDEMLAKIQQHTAWSSIEFWTTITSAPNTGEPEVVSDAPLVHLPGQYLPEDQRARQLAQLPASYLAADRRARQLEAREDRTPRELESDDEAYADSCDLTVPVPDDATPCPPAGEVICGNATGMAPDGTVLLRPFRRLLTECAAGCVCDENATAAVSYESCAEKPSTYLYTGEQCNLAFSIAGADEAALANGVKLTYLPLLDGGGFNEPTVALHAKPDLRYAGDSGGEHLFDENVDARYAVTVRYKAPTALDLDDEAASLISIPPTGGFPSSIPFIGEHYDTMSIASNGYVAFDLGANPHILSEATAEAQFCEERGPSFSLLLTDFNKPNVYVAHVERVSMANVRPPVVKADEPPSPPSTPPSPPLTPPASPPSLPPPLPAKPPSLLEDAPSPPAASTGAKLVTPFATVVTYKGAEMDTFGTEDAVSRATVQAFFYHETGKIELVIGDLPADIDAIVGPSSGTGPGQAAAVRSISELLRGDLLSTGNSTSAPCDVEDEEDETPWGLDNETDASAAEDDWVLY